MEEAAENSKELSDCACGSGMDGYEEIRWDCTCCDIDRGSDSAMEISGIWCCK
jgi:hypothetical protein